MSAVRVELFRVIDQELERMRPIAVARLRKSHQDNAEDAFQEGAIRALRGSDTYDPSRGSVRSWLTSIVFNTGFDFGRSTGREREHYQFVENPEEKLSVCETGETPEDVVIFSEQQNMIASAISDLSNEQKQVIELTFFEDKKQREIAESMQTPIGTVKTRTMRALGNLGKNPTVREWVRE